MVENTTRSINEITHFILKIEDIFKYLEEPEIQTLEILLNKIKKGRAKDDKNPNNQYYICNTDEKYASLVLDIITLGEENKAYGKITSNLLTSQNNDSQQKG